MIGTRKGYFGTETRFEMTPERERRIDEVRANRQGDLTVIFENIDDPHNISACLRTCDAVGIEEVYIITSPSRTSSKLGKKSSASASKWIKIHHSTDVADCINTARMKYSKIYSTFLGSGSVSLYDLNLCEPVALVFGNEHWGVSKEMSELCDGNFVIPQVGMIRSLNVSVACAVSLYEAFRQRSHAGRYPSLTL
jgi:tRNA (guanosine-2'-O-)-methyltransferase